MKEKMKKNWRIILIVLGFLILMVLYFLFVFDIGLNSKYFAKKDFNNAFLARQTGNCNIFKDYVSEQYREIWYKRCINEKGRIDNQFPIKTFTIKNITINQSKAFLQVEIERDIDIAARAIIEKELGRKFEAIYTLNYDMQRTNLTKFLYILPKTRWIITNEIK